MKIIYCETDKGVEYYLENKREQEMIRIRDKKQIELMDVMYGAQVTKEKIERLINRDEWRYFDSVDEYKINR